VTLETMPLSKALNAGMRKAMENDPKVLLMGEDIGKLGGVFRVTEHLQRDFGDRRVLDTPLAESGIVGTAIGMAMVGFRPVIEVQFDGFVFPAFDQITTQLAKLTNRHEGAISMPIVIRIPYGGHIGAVEHHQESPEAYFAHTPGLRVVSPSTPNDAYWMIQEAIASNDPVIFMEPKSRYWQKGEVELDASAVPLHSSRVVRSGSDVTLVGHGAMVTTLLQAAALAEAEGTSCEVVDRHGACVLRARGSGAARLRLRHPVPAGQARGRVPPGCRPHPRGRRSLTGLLTPISCSQLRKNPSDPGFRCVRMRFGRRHS
jgi:2-oxoisovalerate dehydrogenase E1 component beta subunit